MDLNKDLLSKIIGGDSWSRVGILDWHVDENITKSGDNHTSNLSRLTVQYQRKGKIFKKSFILKVPSVHPMYKVGLRFKLYDKELPIYAHILEEMYKIDGEHIGPRLYYVDGKHSLILKDLSQSGYKIVDRVKQLDYEQCRLVFKSLAKFHALSIKLDQMGKISSSMKTICCFFDSHNSQESQEFMQNVCQRVAKISFNDDKLNNLVRKLTNNLFESVLDELRSEKFTLRLLNHGDCWTGNTLFKFDKYGIVKKVKLIDFQRCNWSTPAHDIIFFTISSMRYEVFQNHFHHLCQTYIESLNLMLHHLGCKPYMMQNLRRDIDNSVNYATSVLLTSLPHLISAHEDSLDCADLFKNGRIDFSYYEKVFENENYLEILGKWMSRYEKEGRFL